MARTAKNRKAEPKLNLKWLWQSYRNSDWLILVTLIGFVLIANAIWIFMNHRPPHWDMGRHLWISLGYYSFLKGHHIIGWLTSYWYHPPLLYQLTAIAYSIFGPHLQVAVLVNSIFVTILALSTYGIGKTLWNRRTGILATWFVLTLPMLVTAFKEFELDAPLSAMVALALYLLIRSRNFSDRRFSWLLGIAIGLGMLTKWSFAFVMFLPLAYATAAMIRDLIKLPQPLRSERLINFAGALLIAYAILSVWYGANLQQLKLDFSANGTQAGIVEGDPVVGTMASNLWYVRNLFINQLYLIPGLFFLVGLVYSIVRSELWRRQRYPLLLLAGTFLVFTFLRNKDPRYTMPALSAVGVIAVAWLNELPRRWFVVTASAIAAFGLLMFVNISFGLPALAKSVSLPVSGIGTVPVIAQHGYIIGPPSSEDWHQEDLFKLITQRSGPNQRVSSAGLDTIWFNNWGTTYYAALYHQDMVNKNPDYVILREESTPRVPTNFTTIVTYQLPDHSVVSLFERQNQ